MVAPANTTFRYRLDSDDVIVWVDRWWLAFARENGAKHLDHDSVVGHDIWQFIGDPPTQGLYREIHQFIRETAGPVTVPFRCDSPSLKRYMQVKISAEDEGGLLYESTLLRVEPQQSVRLLESDRGRSDAFLTMCSCCKRSLLEPAGWLDLRSISLRLRLFDEQRVPEIRYTVCPECKAAADAQRKHPPALS